MKAHGFIKTHVFTIARGYSCAPKLWAHGRPGHIETHECELDKIELKL